MNTPITAQFYKGVPDVRVDENERNFPFDLDSFSSMCIAAVYVIDFYKRGFHYVANHDLFLCGHSKEVAISLGYDFYPKLIHRDDLPLLVEMHTAIVKRLAKMNDADGINFFAFTIRIKNGYDYLMAHHKIKPIFVDGMIRFGVCMLASSTAPMQGFPAHLLLRQNRLRGIFAKRQAMEGKTATDTHRTGKEYTQISQTGEIG
jgi:hypothetical protein